MLLLTYSLYIHALIYRFIFVAIVSYSTLLVLVPRPHWWVFLGSASFWLSSSIVPKIRYPYRLHDDNACTPSESTIGR